MSKHHHGHKHHHHSDHDKKDHGDKKDQKPVVDAPKEPAKASEPAAPKEDPKVDPIAPVEIPEPVEPQTPPAPPEAKPDDSPVPSPVESTLPPVEPLPEVESGIAADAPAAVDEPKKDPANDPVQGPTEADVPSDSTPDATPDSQKHFSESARVQEDNANTTTGKVINPGTTDATIEIVQHATPAADAAIAAQKRDEAIANGETPEYHPEADAMNPGPKVEEIADSSSGNSITGATAPLPFAPWDDAKEKSDTAKDELAQNLADAAKPATADGQMQDLVPSTDSTTAEQATDTTPGTDDLTNASGLSATDETAPVPLDDAAKTDSAKPEDSDAPKSADKSDEVLQ